MRKIYILIFIAIGLSSCTVEKTPFGNRLHFTSRGEQREVGYFKENKHLISIEAPDGEFLRGYNKISVKISTPNNEDVITDVTFRPSYTDKEGRKITIPYSYNLIKSMKDNSFHGFVVFNTPKKYSVLNATHTGIKTPWNIEITYKVNGTAYSIQNTLNVLDTRNPNLNMTQFQGRDGKKYMIALTAPEIPKVALNDLSAGIWVQQPDSTYTVANNYLLELDPRMPGEDMGNHSSPDNQDLTQGADGFYHGKVNYTMSGYWTLNFILKDTQKRVIKGTEVPDTVKMGVFGEQSELHIDILF